MDGNLRENGPFERLLTVRLAEGDLEAAKDRAARKLARQLKIKGFRPGKAPRRIVEAQVGSDTLRTEAIEEALPSVLGTALQEAELVPATTPQVADLRDTDDGVEVDVRITLWPKLERIPEYRGREVTVGSPAVSEEEVDGQLDRLREQFAELETVSRPAREGDYVSIDLSTSHHGRPIEEASAQDLLYEVGSGSFVERLDEQLTGSGPGAILRFNAPLPQGFGEQAGQEVTFQVLVKDVRQKRLPEATDEWVSEVTEFETVADLRGRLREGLLQMKGSAVRAQLQNKLLDQLLEEADLELPEALVRAEMERVLHGLAHQLEERGETLERYLAATGQDQGAFIADLRNEAELRLMTTVLLEAVAEAEGLEVSDEELDEALAAIEEGAEGDASQRRERLRKAGAEEALMGDILRRKAADLLLEAAVPVDDQGDRIDLQDVTAFADTEADAREPVEAEEA